MCVICTLVLLGYLFSVMPPLGSSPLGLYRLGQTAPLPLVR